MIRLFAIAFLAVLTASATEYRYVVTGNTAADECVKFDPSTGTLSAINCAGGPGYVILTVNTESPDFKSRLDWISERASLLPPILRDYVNHAPAVDASANPIPGSDVPTFWGQACWKKDSRELCLDVRMIATGDYGPMHALWSLNLGLGLGKDGDAIAKLRYAPPKPPAPPKDCEAPGTPVSCEELPGQPGRFKSRNLGRPVGEVWTAPSGASYKLTNIGGIFFYLAWVRQ